MCSWRDALTALLALVALGASAQDRYAGIGRPATPKEIAAWDIDVRPDFKGLPPGRGTVAQGQVVWEAKCAGCHGIFGESGEVFMPLVGGTTARDVETGRVARLTDPAFPARTTMADVASGRVARLTDAAYPVRTTLMKLAHVSTLWDYIHRAMPWTAPKSLAPDEVYAVTAYLLHLGEVLPAEFELSERNIAQVQQRLPNRNGLSTAHALWPGREFGGTARPDVQGSACMKNCLPSAATAMKP